jgi:hypothetical protein
MTPTTSTPDELGAAHGSGPSLREQLAAAQAEISRLKKITRCQREPDKTTLGGIIQTAREAAGMTLREAAAKAGWLQVSSHASSAMLSPQIQR